MYNNLQDKPLTFLQLLWIYETRKREAEMASLARQTPRRVHN